MKLRIFNYAYYNILENKYDPELECPIWVASCRDKNGKYHFIRVAGNKKHFRPHFYVDNTESNKSLCEELGLEWQNWDKDAIYNDEDVIAIYTQFPYQVRRVRDTFPRTYEADVEYAKMFVMELGLEQGYIEVPDDKTWLDPQDIRELPEDEHFYVEERIKYFDIETEPIKGTNFDLDNQRIISIVVYDNYDNTYYRIEWDDYDQEWEEKDRVKKQFRHEDLSDYSDQITYHLKTEKDLIVKFFELFKDRPDGIFTFNGHGGNQLITKQSETKRVWRNGFDEPIVYKRALHFGLKKEMQQMSPLPPIKNKYGRYYGVYERGRGDKCEIVTRGTTPLDFYYAEPLMNYTTKYTDFFGRGLDAYLRYFSNFHKIEHPGLTVSQLKQQDLEKELLYNKIDVEGMVFLNKRFDFSRDIFDTVSMTLVPGIDLLSATRVHDFLTLKESHDYCVYDTKWQDFQRDTWQGWLMEKKDKWNIKMEKNNKAGGYNVEMKKGSSGWTVIMDFSSLYPTLSYSANAGIDTLIQVEEEFEDYIIDRNGKKWNKKDIILTPAGPFMKPEERESIERKIWGKLLRIRQKYKDLKNEYLDKYEDPNHPKVKLYESKQYNLKQRLVNNKYGASGNPGYRAKNLAVYNTPPSMGQVCTRQLAVEFLPSIDYQAKAGDSDSIMVYLKSNSLEDCIEEVEEFLLPKANDFVDMLLKREFNIDDNTVNLGWEKIGPRFYGHKKKNYAMEVWAEDGKILPESARYILYKGFKLKKRNRADITEVVQKIFIKKALWEDDNRNLLDQITEVIWRCNKVFPYLDWTKISQRMTIKKDLEKYSESYPNRRAADFHNKLEFLDKEYGRNSHGFFGNLDIDTPARLEPVIMFNRDEIRDLKKYGYQLDYETHKQKYAKDKLNLLLEDYYTDWDSLLKSDKISSVFEI